MMFSKLCQCSQPVTLRLLPIACAIGLILPALPGHASDPAFPTGEQIATAARAMGQSGPQGKLQDIRFCPGDPADVDRLNQSVRCYVARHSAADGLYHVIASYNRPAPTGGSSIVDGMMRIGQWLYETVAGNIPADPAPIDATAFIDEAVGTATRQSAASVTAAEESHRGAANATREATAMFGEVAQSAVRRTGMATPLGLDLMPTLAMPQSYPYPSNYPSSYTPPRRAPVAKPTPGTRCVLPANAPPGASCAARDTGGR